MARPGHFYPDPIRKHLQSKHDTSSDAVSNNSRNKPARLEQELQSYVNSLVLLFADSNIPMRCVERSTFYNSQRRMYQLGQIAGKDVSFEQIFEAGKIQTRRKLAADSKRISGEFQNLLDLLLGDKILSLHSKHKN